MRTSFFKLFIWFFVLASCSGAAYAQSFSEAEIKAAYIFKLAKFITWNGAHKSHIKFCYVESARSSEDISVGNSFKRLVSTKNAQDQWSVTHIRGLDGIKNCDVLFIAETEASSLSNILSLIGNADILTISDIRRFISKDGMLGFTLDNEDRVKMEANLGAIRKTNVMLSAVVLELMQQVVQ